MQVEAKKYGTGAHIVVPKDWAGKKIEIVPLDDTNTGKPITWKNIEKLIWDKIEEAKRGY